MLKVATILQVTSELLLKKFLMNHSFDTWKAMGRGSQQRLMIGEGG